MRGLLIVNGFVQEANFLALRDALCAAAQPQGISLDARTNDALLFYQFIYNSSGGHIFLKGPAIRSCYVLLQPVLKRLVQLLTALQHKTAVTDNHIFLSAVYGRKLTQLIIGNRNVRMAVQISLAQILTAQG